MAIAGSAGASPFQVGFKSPCFFFEGGTGFVNRVLQFRSEGHGHVRWLIVS